MTYHIHSVSRLRQWLTVILVAALPFHAFLITALKTIVSEGTFLTLASSWKEILVIILIALMSVEIAQRKKILPLDLLDWLIMSFAALSFIWLFFQRGQILQWAFGFRFDVLPLALILWVRRVPWPNFEKLIKVISVTGAIVMMIGLVHALALPSDFFTYFGYAPPGGGYNPEIGIASCQYLEHTPHICRATSTFGGPTRYGTYLLLLLGISFMIRWKSPPLRGAYIILIFSNILLTFSRSVWLGALAMGLIAAAWYMPKNFKKIAAGVGLILIVLAAFTWSLQSENLHNMFRSIFVRASSTSEHFVYMKKGVEAVVEHPLGMGLGTVGPASVRFEKFLTENWFLQIGGEMGLIGLILFLGILIMLFTKLKNTPARARGIFLSLLGISVAGLFSHSFEETASFVTLMILIGGLLSTSRYARSPA